VTVLRQGDCGLARRRRRGARGQRSRDRFLRGPMSGDFDGNNCAFSNSVNLEKPGRPHHAGGNPIDTPRLFRKTAPVAPASSRCADIFFNAFPDHTVADPRLIHGKLLSKHATLGPEMSSICAYHLPGVSTISSEDGGRSRWQYSRRRCRLQSPPGWPYDWGFREL